jgi:formylglycine-generating enzyme required for sulfatase activity
MGTTPWVGEQNAKAGPDYPAIQIAWQEATDFCSKLTSQEREAGRLPDDWEYTLPTDAQWEYACRAGTKSTFSFGDDPKQLSEHAWWGGFEGHGNAENERFAHPVGTKRPNPWGLHDMHGNVWEFCRDAFQNKPPGGADPLVTSEGSSPVYRGGSWFDDHSACDSTTRRTQPLPHKANNVGFRVVLVQIR